MTTESFLDPLITLVVNGALGVLFAVALYAAYSFVRALLSLRDVHCRRRVLQLHG